jgi:hypothetical protein
MAVYGDGAAASGTAASGTAPGRPAPTGTPPGRPAPARPATGARTTAWLRSGRFTLGDLLALASFVAAAVALTARLWPASEGVLNRQDQAFFEWMLAHGARVLTEGVNPFFSTQMNAPDGVNMMANTSVLGISIPLAPLTMAVGPHAAFTVFLTGALVATAASWYLLLSRPLRLARPAAWVGGLFCAFAPGMVSQANGHPNIVAQFLVPVIIWRTLKLREEGRWLRNGLLLALPIVWQAVINLEILFMTAVGLFVFVALMAALSGDARRAWRPFLAGLAVAGGVSLVVLAYPIWYHFRGPQAYLGLPDNVRNFGADLAAYPAFARQSLAGDADIAKRLAQNPSEENAFFGWPVLVLVGLTVVACIRRTYVIALLVAGLVLAAFSLGPKVKVDGVATSLPSVWGFVTDLPLLNAVVPTRWALATIPVVGLLLAVGLDRALAFAAPRPSAGIAVRIATALVFAAALLPIVPTTLPSQEFKAAPEFVTSGAWREYTADGRSVMFVPVVSSVATDPLRWSAAVRNDLRFTQGYFLGPNDTDGKATFTAPRRPTTTFLSLVKAKKPAPVTPSLRSGAIEDLRYWRAGAVVLVPGVDAARYRAALTELYGYEPRAVGGVWLWDTRGVAA